MRNSPSIPSTVLIAVTLILASGFARPQATDFTRTTIEGKPIKLSDFRGKWVVLNFWATYCGPCLRELPMLARFHRRHAADDAVVIGVNFEIIDLPTLRAFIDKMAIPFPNIQVGDAPLVPFEPLERGLPETFFINPDGEYVDKHIGELGYQDLLDYTGLVED